MNPKALLAFLLALLAIPLLAFAVDAPPATDKAADLENMRKIGAALNAYKKAKGDFPDYLSDLVPEFLDAKTLVSPLGTEDDPHAAKGEYDPKLPCSYSYEFGARKSGVADLTFRALKTLEMQESGPTVPILRRFLDAKMALNLSHAGDLFESHGDWTFSEEVEPLLKKNGLGPGIREGKKLALTITDQTGQPIPGIAVLAAGRTAYGRALSLPARNYTADATGKALIPLGPGGQSYLQITSASPSWYIPYRPWFPKEDTTPKENELVPLALTAEPAGTMGGTICDPQGAPISGVRMMIADDEDPQKTPALLGFAITDDHGAWSMPSVPLKKHPYLIWARQRGYRWIEHRAGTHGLPDAATLFTGKAELRFQPPFPVKGIVRSGDRPVAGAHVSLDSHFTANDGQATTDAEGRFEIPAVIEWEDNMGLLVTADNLAPRLEMVKIAVDAPPFNVNLEAGRPLTGRIFRGKNTPVANAPVLFREFSRAHSGGFTPVAQPVIATTDEEGRFTWAHAPKDFIGCVLLPPEGGDPIIFEWDATQDHPPDVHLKP